MDRDANEGFHFIQPSGRRLRRAAGEHLRTRGLDPRFDWNITYSARWWSTIVNELRDADAVVLVMSPELEDSVWVEREILFAQRVGKPIFPLRCV